MSRYVLELNSDIIKSIVAFGMMGETGVSTVFKIDELEELNSDYINEHYGDLQDTAYKRGVNDGSLDVKERVDGAYQKGLEDGKAVHEKGCEGCKYECETAERNPCISCSNYYQNYWAAKDDKIEVGDEVRRKSAPKSERGGIVTKDWENSYFIMWTDGSSGQWDKDKVVKTGRHFDIASILEDMHK